MDGKKVDEPIQLIVCDLDMPDNSGMDLYQELQNGGNLGDAKFILMSGSGDAATIKQAIGLGITNILLKPFSQQDLVDKLAAIYK